MAAPEKPSKIDICKEPPGLVVEWADGVKRTMSFELLRRACPCAQCKGERLPIDPSPMSLPVQKNLTPLQTEAKEMFPIGTYAIGFLWGDGHKVGIYTFEYLRDMAESMPET